jgi:hypothetical protein
MTPAEYTTWQAFYRSVFCVAAAPTDAAMFSHWGEVLGAFDFAELRAATLSVASSPEPRAGWRQNHLSMLKAEVMAARFKRQRAEQDELDRQYRSAGECERKCTAGMIFVPHPHCMVSDDWAYPYYTAVVVCTCSRGSIRFNNRSEHDADKRRDPWLDIRSYEALYPEWEELVHRHNAKIQSERASEFFAKKADSTNPIDLARARDWVLKNSRAALGADKQAVTVTSNP